MARGWHVQSVSFGLWSDSWLPWLSRASHRNTYVGRIFCVFQRSQACVLGERCVEELLVRETGRLEALAFCLLNYIFFFLFKATNPALGCLPINQEYFFISAKLSLMLSCWWHMRLARAGTLLRVLTPLSSIPRNSYRFSIGPRTDQCLLYINTILTIENCLIYFSPPLVNWWCRSSSWLTADFSAMICSSAHANDVRLFSEIGRLYHIFLGFTHDHFFPVVAEWWVLKAQYRLTGCWV